MFYIIVNSPSLEKYNAIDVIERRGNRAILKLINKKVLLINKYSCYERNARNTYKY